MHFYNLGSPRELFEDGFDDACVRAGTRFPKITSLKNDSNAQNSLNTLAPIWLPHWPACKCTISRIFEQIRARIQRLEMEMGGWVKRRITGWWLLLALDGPGFCCTASKSVYWAEAVAQSDVIAMATKDRRREGRDYRGWGIGCIEAAGIRQDLFVLTLIVSTTP